MYGWIRTSAYQNAYTGEIIFCAPPKRGRKNWNVIVTRRYVKLP